MDEKLQRLRTAFTKLAAQDTDNHTKRSLDQLPELPFRTWDDLLEQLRTGAVEIREMAVYPGDFGLFADRGTRFAFEALRLTSLTLPIVGIVLTLIFAWWCVFLVPLALLPLQLAKAVYRRTIAATATMAEDVFCVLFSRNLIFLFRKHAPPLYRDNREATDST